MGVHPGEPKHVTFFCVHEAGFQALADSIHKTFTAEHMDFSGLQDLKGKKAEELLSSGLSLARVL